MPFELKHTLFAREFRLATRTSGDQGVVEVDQKGSFAVLFTGRVQLGAKAEFFYRQRVDHPETITPPGDPEPQLLHGGFETQRKTFALTLRIFTPDGQEFTAPEITLAHLRKFRDPRGGPSGSWSYHVTGRSETLTMDAESRVVNTRGFVAMRLTETVASQSAPDLVANAPLSKGSQVFTFDLYRVGTFLAEIRPGKALTPWKGRMRLVDPDGAVVAETEGSRLKFSVELPTLNRSRTSKGDARPWTLQVVSMVAATVLARPRLTATVIGEGKVTLATIQSRIDALLGDQGRFLEIFGENRTGEALIQLKINDVVSAETIDFHPLLDAVVDGIDPDKGIEAETVYTLFRAPEEREFGTTVDVSSVKVESIELSVGPGVKLGPAVPAFRLTITVSGKAVVRFGPVAIADVKVPGNKIEIEVGMTVAADGTPRTVVFVPDTILDGDVRVGAAAALSALGPIGIAMAVGLAGKVDGIVTNQFNDPIVSGIRKAIEDPALAPSILMPILGAHLTYRPFRIEAGAFFLNHVAPLEPEPKQLTSYHPAIGRPFTVIGPNAVRFSPLLLPDTWKAGNLAKIEHIVVVMMENRSYDHVLGYRAQLGDRSDGLSQDVIDAIERTPGAKDTDRQYRVRRLQEAGFDANLLGRRTGLPTTVGHAARDVQEQLRFQVAGPGGRKINSPRGFVDNFVPEMQPEPGQSPNKVVFNDVLGFYDQDDLPFYDFLAEHYAYSDRYYCSHPGPTMPNRMYSLTGDLQYDRYGFPIVENNNGDNFLLSRAQTIFDVLWRRSISFRVYESDPSVTMLRMFTRYATDDTHIQPLAQFFVDAEAGNLPSYAMVEPRMHSHPVDDDHPPADMHRGQIFVKSVYDALRRSGRWDKTLLIVTYDEHGGLYDHRIPPVAELVGSESVLHPGFGGAPPIAPGSSGAQESLLPIRYGVRVPTFVVSPWTTTGKGPAVLLDHCSILKTVLARFLGAEKPFMSDRVSASHSFDAFLSAAAPRMDVPEPPDLHEGSFLEAERTGPSPRSKIITPTLSRQQMRKGPVEFHDLAGRWARQLGHGDVKNRPEQRPQAVRRQPVTIGRG